MSRKRQRSEEEDREDPEIKRVADSVTGYIVDVLDCHLAYSEPRADSWHEHFQTERDDPNPTPERVFAERVVNNKGIEKILKFYIKRALQRAKERGIDLLDERAAAAFDFTQ